MHPHSARMRARLAQIDEQLLLLQKEKTTLEHALATAIYPVLTLPSEITSEIFARCVEWHREPDPKHAPLLITYVCRAWRDIAIHDPTLWNSVRFICRHGGERNSYSSHLAKLYLERAGTTPLDLLVEIWLTVEAGGRPRLLQDVIDRSSQWRKVVFHVSVATLSDQFLGQLDLPILETLSLFRTRDSPGFFHSSAFAVAPKLQVVTLLDNSNPSSIMLPWSQLTKITIPYCTWKSCIEVLGSAPNLVDLTFDPILPPRDYSDAVLAPYLHLKRLCVGGPELDAVLCRLNLPNLEQLEVLPGSMLDNSESRPGLLSFFRRSPKLSQFSCSFVNSRRSFLLPLLVEMPNLSLLRLTASSCEVDAILRNLHQSPSFLPFIQNLSLAVLYGDGYGSNHITADVLSEAVFARWSSGSNAVERRSFRVIWEDWYNEDTDEWEDGIEKLVLDDRLLELRRQGVDIHIGTEGKPWI
ncbi:hypothetical protein C8F04DRAFT_1147087 [Mycena alexandri]|uniref:F-box domain-containing protein n=1 Tax=Mycena alexandri TaxID=1745969 RepID=A0AAD6S359_9AGAR|nr:hypothetical protein C8F04DRAFT_1147087 [Mycena alexandri]